MRRTPEFRRDLPANRHILKCRRTAMPVQTKIDINQASREDLLSIEGIGETMADAIIRFREKHGNFKSVDDIDKVPGIGESRLEHIKSSLAVSGEFARYGVESKKFSKSKTTSKRKPEHGKSGSHGRSGW
jgi:competence protein ComEA